MASTSPGRRGRPRFRPAFVGHRRVLVHTPADPVAAEVGVDPVAAAAADPADGMRDVTQPRARRGGPDAGQQGAAGGLGQPGVGRARRADDERDGRIARPAVDLGAAVDADHVTIGEPGVAGDTVQRGIVDRGAITAGNGTGANPGW